MRFTLAVLATIALAPLGAQPVRPEPTKVFLDCNFCDFDFIRVETPWASFVRDRNVSDVHLLLTSQETGAGGTRYLLEAIGQASPRRDTLQFSTAPNSTDDAVRSEILRNIQLSLVPFALRTEAGRSLRLSRATTSDDDDERPRSGPDRWNAWVFEISSGASIEKEQRQSDLSLDADFDGQRITRTSKLGMSFGMDYERSRFELDDDEGIVTSTQEEYEAGAIGIRNLAAHWGYGAQVSVRRSTFDNFRLRVRAAPAVEYSVWSYDEATRRQMVFQYSMGIAAVRYNEETIFDRLKETRPTHAFAAAYRMRQPWGSANAAVLASSYLDDFAKNRLEFEMSWSLRLIRGLELEIGGNTSLIHDQLSIPKRGATPEEILLEQRALRTDYRYDVFVGFSYTFGSIFNSVVNPRFGSGIGNILY